MVFKFGQYDVDIDIEKTQNFYRDAQRVSDGCICDDCENFEKAVKTLPQTVIDFFEALGIDMQKICECYVNCANEDGTLLYGGFYHVCGTILGGVSAWVPTATGTSHWEYDLTFSVNQDMQISFQTPLDLLEKDFPIPVIQLEISANIPWVLKSLPKIYLSASDSTQNSH